MANNPNLPISTGNLNEYHTRVIGNLSQTGITGQTVAAQLYALNSSQQSKTMTAKFNLSDSNPETWGEYMDDAVNMTAGSDVWDAFFGIKPVMIKNGAIVGELDPSQGYAKYKDGTSADITTGADGDVMIYCPRRDIRIWIDSGYLYVSMTQELDKENYTHYAHTYKGSDCDWFARGRYKGYYDGSSLRSLSGKAPKVETTLATFRTYARANGTGYEQNAFYQLMYWQVMYMLKYAGKNAQVAIGRGYVDGNSARHNTGGTDSLGMDYGESTGHVQMSFLGCEDFYGNVFDRVDGLYSDSSRKLYASDGDYNDTGSGYTAITTATATANRHGYLRNVIGTSEGGFAMDVSNTTYGSATTYLCDDAWVNNACLAVHGRAWSAGDTAGVFALDNGDASNNAQNNRGARLMYMHVAQ